MTTLTELDLATRIARLAQRLGFDGPNAAEQVLDMALEYLEDSTAQPAPLYTRERRDAAAQLVAAEIADEYRQLSAAGRRWREEHPDEYDPDNPPSKVWQEELYDENGLPV